MQKKNNYSSETEEKKTTFCFRLPNKIDSKYSQLQTDSCNTVLMHVENRLREKRVLIQTILCLSSPWLFLTYGVNFDHIRCNQNGIITSTLRNRKGQWPRFFFVLKITTFIEKNVTWIEFFQMLCVNPFWRILVHTFLTTANIWN